MDSNSLHLEAASKQHSDVDATTYARNFNVVTAVALCVCVSATWVAIAASLLQVIGTSGITGLVYGYLLVASAMTAVVMSLAEFASIWPTSGAQYHWTAHLAPRNMRSALCWIDGWLSIGYTVLTVIGSAMGAATQIQGYVMLSHPYYEPKSWHVFLMYVAIIVLFYVPINIWGLRLLSWSTTSALVTHVVGFIVTFVVVLACQPEKSSATAVFATLTDASGWGSKGLAFCIGLATSAAAFSGVETAAHYAEEIRDAARQLPKAMVLATGANAVFTFPWVVSIAFGLGDVTSLLQSRVLLQSLFAQIYVTLTKSPAAGIFISCFVTYVAVIGGASCLGSAARMVKAMADDHAFPSRFAHIHPTLRVPIDAILLCTLPCLVGIIYIWNSTAFFGVISGGVQMYTLSYTIPIGLHLFYARKHLNLQYGPWNLGSWSTSVNAVAFVWALFINIFLAFPIYGDVTPGNMNYSVLIVSGILFLSLGFYLAYGRSRYYGPVSVVTIDALETSPSNVVNPGVYSTTFGDKSKNVGAVTVGA